MVHFLNRDLEFLHEDFSETSVLAFRLGRRHARAFEYTLNNITALKDPDGGITVRFGGCGKGMANCAELLDGSWNYRTQPAS